MIKNKFFVKQSVFVRDFDHRNEAYIATETIFGIEEFNNKLRYKTISGEFMEDDVFRTYEEAEVALNKIDWKVGDECYFLLGGRIRKGKVTQDSDILKGYQILFNNKEIINCYFEEMFKTKAELLKYLDESCDD